jgi:hypothetical protein
MKFVQCPVRAVLLRPSISKNDGRATQELTMNIVYILKSGSGTAFFKRRFL